MNKFCVLTALLLVILLNSIAFAQEAYQTELSIGHHRSTVDDKRVGAIDDKSKVSSFGFKQYLTSVNPASHPLAEAAFLERVGSFELQYEIIKSKDEPNLSFDASSYGAQISYMNPQQPFVLQGSYSKIDGEVESLLNGDITVESYDIKFAWFLKDGFIIGMGYSYTEADINVTGLGVTLNAHLVSDGYEINSKFVKELDNRKAINIESAIGQIKDSDGNNNIILEISGDYYLNPRMSLGGGLALNTGDDKGDEGKTLILNVHSFIKHNVSIGLEIEQFRADNTVGENEDEIDLELLVRF